jgi:hypothetical protein
VDASPQEPSQGVQGLNEPSSSRFEFADDNVLRSGFPVGGRFWVEKRLEFCGAESLRLPGALVPNRTSTHQSLYARSRRSGCPAPDGINHFLLSAVITADLRVAA